MTTYTKGPWHPGHLGQDGNCQCRTVVCEHLEGGIATVHIHNGIESIAHGGNDCPPRQEAIANMHLISAAPDMYEALEVCKSAMRAIGNNIAEFGSVTDQEFWDALWEAEATALVALLKAKGEA